MYLAPEGQTPELISVLVREALHSFAKLYSPVTVEWRHEYLVHIGRRPDHPTESLRICCEQQTDQTQEKAGWNGSKESLLSIKILWTGSEFYQVITVFKFVIESMLGDVK